MSCDSRPNPRAQARFVALDGQRGLAVIGVALTRCLDATRLRGRLVQPGQCFLPRGTADSRPASRARRDRYGGMGAVCEPFLQGRPVQPGISSTPAN